MDWTQYTVHDAANLLLRYLLQLPVSVIPPKIYDHFRSTLREDKAAGTSAAEATIRTYQSLITAMPKMDRQLLLYVLDLLAVFANKSDLNKMTTAKLAAVFQPGLLSHPEHHLSPNEQQLSQDVLVFLIDYQDNFLIGMPGTAAEHKTT
jgi:GTPase-activating protein SAC7